LAFREIDKPGVFDMSVVDRIILYRKYNADRNYLEKLYVELLGRPESLTIEEGDKLSLKLALLISGARERLRVTSDKLALSDPLPETMIDTIKAMVVSMFWDGPTLDSSCVTSSDDRTNGKVTSTVPIASKGEYPQDLLHMYQHPLTISLGDGPNSDADSFFRVTGKKGKKKTGLIGDWDDEV